MAGGLVKTSESWAMLPIRLALGAIMFAHGAQKVLAVWGGPGLSNWANQPAPFAEMRPSWMWMGAAALSEFIGGALVMIGLYTRIGAFFIACVMIVAIFGVHWQNGFFLRNSGFEFPLALLGMALTLLIFGGGAASIDAQIQGK
ncbi:MAG TPA: DoxX family protein [Blastocatellia bacterium]|nr:DoxX family protein [Blastocatellia bacterium]